MISWCSYVKTSVRSTAAPLSDATRRLFEQHDEQERKAICDWLSLLTFGAKQSDLISQRSEGTGQWLLTSVKYRGWERLPKQTLFCPGLPGAGKTIMLSIVVDRLMKMVQDNTTTAVAYLYCTYQPQQQHSPEDFFLCLLRQLTQQQKVSAEMQSFYNSHKTNGTNPSLSEILRVLESAIQHFSRVFFLVDALDEFHISNNRGQDTFVTGLLNLQAKTCLNLFITSRFIPEITSHFQASICEEIRAHDEDIISYVDGRVPQLLRSNIIQCAEYQEIKSMVRNAVANATDGM